MAGHSDHPCDVSFSLLLKRWEGLIRSIVISLGFYQSSHDHSGMTAEDAMQAGSLGLWFASKKYDPNNRTVFSSYATIRIRGEILDELRRNGWTCGQKRNPVSVGYYDFHDYKASEDVFEEVATQELREMMDTEVNAMDFKRRNIFHGWMQHEQVKKDKLQSSSSKNPADKWCVDRDKVVDILGVSAHRGYQLRDDIRKKLRVIH